MTIRSYLAIKNYLGIRHGLKLTLLIGASLFMLSPKQPVYAQSTEGDILPLCLEQTGNANGWAWNGASCIGSNMPACPAGTALGPINADHRNVRWVNNQSCYVVSGTTSDPTDDTPTTTTPTTDTGDNMLPLCLEKTGNANGWAWNGASCIGSNMPACPAGTALGPVNAEHRNVRWVNNQSCYVVSGTTSDPTDDTPTTTTPTTDTGDNMLPLCLEQTGNANGWAWNGASCIGSNMPACPAGTALGPVNAEHRNVRWVNNQSCYVVSGTTSDPTDDTPTGNIDYSAITDVILMAGQSNASGQNSVADINSQADEPTSRIVVWVPDQSTDQNGNDNATGENGSWQIANLCAQNWYVAKYHTEAVTKYGANGSGGLKNYPGQLWQDACQNHPGFQIAKGIVNTPGQNRTVALIATSLPGMSITQWAAGQPGRRQIDTIVNAALQELRNKGVPRNVAYVKYVAWAQGEDDRIDPDNGDSSYYLAFKNLAEYFRDSKLFRSNDNINSATRGIVVAQSLAPNNTVCGASGSPGDGATNQFDVNEVSTNVNSAFADLKSESLIKNIDNAADACSVDTTHYNSKTQRQLGKRHASIFFNPSQ